MLRTEMVRINLANGASAHAAALAAAQITAGTTGEDHVCIMIGDFGNWHGTLFCRSDYYRVLRI